MLEGWTQSLSILSHDRTSPAGDLVGGQISWSAPAFPPRMTSMTLERNRTSILRFFRDVIGAGNLDLLDELAVDDYEDHVALPGQGRGQEGLKRTVAKICAAFPPSDQ